MPRVPNLPSISPGSSSVFVGDDGTSTGAFSRNSVCADVIESYSGSTLAGSAQSVKAAINGLNSKVSALSTSTTAVPTAAAMTDTSKIYVYTGSETGYTNGNWYYYDGSAWVSGGVFNAAGCDGALSDTSTNAVQNKVVNGAIDDLKSALNDNLITIYSKNRFNINDIEAGYVNQVTGAWASGSSSYSGTPNMIEVTGTPFVVALYRYAGTVNLTFRYAVYDANGDYITGAIVPKEDFTIIDNPTDTNQKCGYLLFNNPNIKYIRFSMSRGYFSSLPVQIEAGQTPTAYTKFDGDITTANGVQIINRSVIGKEGLTFHVSSVQQNATVKIGIENSIKKNKVYHLHTLINSGFSSLLFGHGKDAYSLYFRVDATNITFLTNGTAGTALAHGLTLDTYIDFMLVVGERNTGTVILNTLGGTYSRTVQIVQGYKGDVFIQPENCTLGETYMTFSSADFRQPFWFFGDSYFTHTSNARWTYWLLEWGFGRCLLNGFPGANSDEALPQVKSYMGMWGIPKYVVWCLGMNDPDSGAVNATWLECVTELISNCQKNGVEPILATIPNVPSLDHTYKNAWVKASGYRYIDFAKAVGAEQAGSSWYTGALSNDNTHPSEIGARLLCQQALLDVPELTQ